MNEKLLSAEKVAKAVRAQADYIINGIKMEVEAQRQEEIGEYKEELQSDINAYTEKELNELRLAAATQESQAKLKIKRDLLLVRSELVEQLFNEVRNDLLKFRNGKEYPEFLAKKLAKIASMTQLEDGYIEVREKDAEIIKDCLKEMKAVCEVKSAAIELGGIRFHSDKNKIEMDETLDAALASQMTWFQNHSGFTI